jgi:hypothetical protein
VDQGNDESKNLDVDLLSEQEIPPARKDQPGGTPVEIM